QNAAKWNPQHQQGNNRGNNQGNNQGNGQMNQLATPDNPNYMPSYYDPQYGQWALQKMIDDMYARWDHYDQFNRDSRQWTDEYNQRGAFKLADLEQQNLDREAETQRMDKLMEALANIGGNIGGAGSGGAGGGAGGVVGGVGALPSIGGIYNASGNQFVNTKDGKVNFNTGIDSPTKVNPQLLDRTARADVGGGNAQAYNDMMAGGSELSQAKNNAQRNTQSSQQQMQGLAGQASAGINAANTGLAMQGNQGNAAMQQAANQGKAARNARAANSSILDLQNRIAQLAMGTFGQG
ncbi:MAG: hypothetical protein Unbinned1524contig1001_1, partial [Prokaryotic dsDNA virus sp.]